MPPFCFLLAAVRTQLYFKPSCNMFNLDCQVLQLIFLQFFKSIQMQSLYNLSLKPVSPTFNDVNMTLNHAWKIVTFISKIKKIPIVGYSHVTKFIVHYIAHRSTSHSLALSSTVPHLLTVSSTGSHLLAVSCSVQPCSICRVQYITLFS